MTSADRDDGISVAGRLARYGGAVLIGLLSFGASLPDPATVPSTIEFTLTMDLALGLVALVTLRWRRRHPLALALVLSLGLAFSAMTAGAWAVAVVSLATRRRVLPSALVVVVATAATTFFEQSVPGSRGTAAAEVSPSLWLSVVAALVLSALMTAIGFYIGARRDLLTSLRERAEAAEEAQATRTEAARAAERARIAREMHDVLGHRISTVAMQAGALAYRDDLTREQMRAAAALTREGAEQAMHDLRDVLGVLRSDVDLGEVGAATARRGAGEAHGNHAGAAGHDHGGDHHGPALRQQRPAPPQPTAIDLPDLVAEAREAGQRVTLDLALDPVDVPDALGRHLYRTVQECLTNARKHAPGEDVTVSVRRRTTGAGPWLDVESTNPLAATASAAEPAWPTSGVGLLGLSERAALAGGTLSYGPESGHFVTRLSVPLRAQETSS